MQLLNLHKKLAKEANLMKLMQLLIVYEDVDIKKQCILEVVVSLSAPLTLRHDRWSPKTT